MIGDMKFNKKLNPKVTELFMRGRKLNISPCFHITILFHSTIKYKTKCNTLFLMKISNKREIVLNHLSNI